MKALSLFGLNNNDPKPTNLVQIKVVVTRGMLYVIRVTNEEELYEYDKHNLLFVFLKTLCNQNPCLFESRGVFGLGITCGNQDTRQMFDRFMKLYSTKLGDEEIIFFEEEII